MALVEAGAIVPTSFQELDKKIAAVYKLLVEAGTIRPKPEPAEPQIPMDFAAAQVIIHLTLVLFSLIGRINDD